MRSRTNTPRVLGDDRSQSSTGFKVKHVHDHEALDVKKNNVATDYGVPAIRWRRRQPPLEIVWAAFNLLSQSRGKRAAHH